MIRVHRRSDVDDEEELDITSMIDMTFLLLIFFMVTSVISENAKPALPKSKAGVTEKVDEQVILVLDFPNGIDMDNREPLTGSQAITLEEALVPNGRVCFRDAPETKVTSRVELLRMLTQKLTERPKKKLILQASRKMPVRVVREVLVMASEAGAQETSVSVLIPN